MWTRAELKARAKDMLRRYYWAAFVVSLIFALVGGNGGSGNVNTRYEDGRVSYRYGRTYEVDPELAQGLPESAGDLLPGIVENVPIGGSAAKIGKLFLGMYAGLLVIVLVVALLLGIFVAPAVEVGQSRFYMESRLIGQSAGVGKVFWGFSHNYLNIVWTMFLRELFVFLGTICLVFPGIYLSYCYYMVPYILAENPDMKPMDALRLSKEMMDGHKFNTFVLELSFFGWCFLGAMACGVGVLFVLPYITATMAELYAVLRGPYSGQLNGFGGPEVVPTGSYGGNYVNPDGVYNGGYGNGQYGGGQYGGGTGGPQEGGQYANWNEFHTGSAESNPGGGPNGGTGQTYQSSQSYGGGYNQGTGGYRTGSGDMDPADGEENLSGNERTTEVNRSEGGPGRGYYLNGVFYPYTDDDK